MDVLRRVPVAGWIAWQLSYGYFPGGHERRHPAPRLDPGEAAADPQHQLIEFPPPALQVYAEASGYRTIFCSPHTFGSSGDGRITSTALRAHDHEVSLEY